MVNMLLNDVDKLIFDISVVKYFITQIMTMFSVCFQKGDNVKKFREEVS